METLVVYVAHLFVLYGTPWTESLHHRYPETLSLAESSLAFVVLFATMVALGIAWHRVKRRYPVAFDRTRWFFTVVLVIAFVLSPAPG